MALFMPMPPNPTQAKLSVSEGARRSGVAPRTCRGMIMAPSASLALSETKSRRENWLDMAMSAWELGVGGRSLRRSDTTLAYHDRSAGMQIGYSRTRIRGMPRTTTDTALVKDPDSLNPVVRMIGLGCPGFSPTQYLRSSVASALSVFAVPAPIAVTRNALLAMHRDRGAKCGRRARARRGKSATTQIPRDVLLETTSSSNEDGSRVWLRTPPTAQRSSCRRRPNPLTAAPPRNRGGLRLREDC